MLVSERTPRLGDLLPSYPSSTSFEEISIQLTSSRDYDLRLVVGRGVGQGCFSKRETLGRGNIPCSHATCDVYEYMTSAKFSGL